MYMYMLHYRWVVLVILIPSYNMKNYRDIIKYQLTTCSTIGHTHKRFKSIKQCLKHQQLLQTTTILHTCTSICKPTFWHTVV